MKLASTVPKPCNSCKVNYQSFALLSYLDFEVFFGDGREHRSNYKFSSFSVEVLSSCCCRLKRQGSSRSETLADGWVGGSAASTYVQVHRAVKQHLQTARAALETIVTAALHLLLLLPLLKNLNPQDSPGLERRYCRCRYLHFWRCHDESLLQTSWSDDTLPRPPQHLLLLLLSIITVIIMTIIILQKWKNPTLSRPDEFNHASSVSRKRSSLDRRTTTTTMGKSTAVTQHCTSKQVQTRLSASFLKYDKSWEVVVLTSSSIEIFRNTTSNDKARTIMYKSKEIINLNSINQPTTRLLLTYTCRTKVPFSSIIEITRGFVRVQERAS